MIAPVRHIGRHLQVAPVAHVLAGRPLRRGIPAVHRRGLLRRPQPPLVVEQLEKDNRIVERRAQRVPQQLGMDGLAGANLARRELCLFQRKPVVENRLRQHHSRRQALREHRLGRARHLYDTQSRARAIRARRDGQALVRERVVQRSL